MAYEIYIATVLLERNRWQAEKRPSFRVSEWADRFAEEGFDGIELWEYHAGDSAEVARLQKSALPVNVLNSYVTFDEKPAEEHKRIGRLAKTLNATRIKFNVGADVQRFDSYVDHVIAWCETLPDHIVPVCECHPGTVVETAEAAAKAFATWQHAGIEAMIHPFNLTPDALRCWFDHVGAHITHAHVQLYREGAMQSLRYDIDTVKHNVNVLKEVGFSGTFSIEFTAGVGKKNENKEHLFHQAVDDMQLLRTML